jgi:hypothetical protein
MEERLENLDHRLARIEQILPTRATKGDLERFATKADLEALRLSTKADIDDATHLARVLHESTRHEIKLVAEGVSSLTERLERKGVI